MVIPLLLLGVMVMLLSRVGYVLYVVNFCSNCPQKVKLETIKTLIVLGSGGHTGEMIKLVAALDPLRYSPRIYVVAASDTHSLQRLQQVEEELKKQDAHQSGYSIEIVPRTREVGQSWISSAFTALWALIVSTLTVLRHRPMLILTNGPGTCVPICIAALVFRIVAICQSRLVFVESLCRVKSLSLSGKILYRLTEDFIVQWPQLKEKYPRSKYFGRLV